MLAPGLAGGRLYDRRGDLGRWRARRRRDLSRASPAQRGIAARHWRGFSPPRVGAAAVEITGLAPLRGGAIQENWAVDARFFGRRVRRGAALVLRTAAPTGVAASLGRLEEFAVLKAAFAAGVTVPEPLFATDDPQYSASRSLSCGGPRDRRRSPDHPGCQLSIRCSQRIAERLGRELGRIHAIRPPRPDLAFLAAYEEVGPTQQIAGFRAYLDRHPTPRPVLEWGIRWLETHIPPPSDPVLCHHDFRTGNYMLDGAELTGILDWEFAGWGDPHEDIGWFCCKGVALCAARPRSRRHCRPRAVLQGYESEFRATVDPRRVSSGRCWRASAGRLSRCSKATAT